jgi:hypothetical protein
MRQIKNILTCWLIGHTLNHGEFSNKYMIAMCGRCKNCFDVSYKPRYGETEWLGKINYEFNDWDNNKTFKL